MTIETYYVKAKSKKALNERLLAGETIYATRYSMYDSTDVNLQSVQNGDVIKIYDKLVSGSPYAKAYGNWDAKKGRVK